MRPAAGPPPTCTVLLITDLTAVLAALPVCGRRQDLPRHVPLVLLSRQAQRVGAHRLDERHRTTLKQEDKVSLLTRARSKYIVVYIQL